MADRSPRDCIRPFPVDEKSMPPSRFSRTYVCTATGLEVKVHFERIDLTMWLNGEQHAATLPGVYAMTTEAGAPVTAVSADSPPSVVHALVPVGTGRVELRLVVNPDTWPESFSRVYTAADGSNVVIRFEPVKDAALCGVMGPYAMTTETGETALSVAAVRYGVAGEGAATMPPPEVYVKRAGGDESELLRLA